MAEPDEAKIREVAEFTGMHEVINRELISAALKDKGNDVSAVVSAYYDDPAKFHSAYTWDETTFAGDREGASDSIPTFNIEAPDNPVIHGVSPTGLHPGAPSRPPSRTQSPLSKLADWAAQNNDAGSVPRTSVQEDTDLKRALAESAAMSGIHSPQETGVTAGDNDISTALPFFGPASRETYEPDQWAMVTTAPLHQEPGPTGRKRTPGAPAFLRSRNTDNSSYFLNGLLTILHAIPGARNTLLRLGPQSNTYGQDSEWWKGSYIPAAGGPPHEEQMTEGNRWDSEFEEYAPGQVQDFVQEVHRLMAFLDDTDRAYGTADGLLQTKPIKSSWDTDADRNFFNTLRDIDEKLVFPRFFSTAGMFEVDHMDNFEDIDYYAILDAPIDAGRCPGGVHNIYQALDSVYWAGLTGLSQDPADATKTTTVMDLGQVQIFNLRLDGLPADKTPFEVPEFFFADRYVYENREMAVELQKKLHSVIKAIDESDKVRHQIITYLDVENVQRDRKVLSEQAIGLGRQKLWQVKAASFWKRYEELRGTPNEIDFSLDDVEGTELSDEKDQRIYKAILAEMAVHKKKLANIEMKLGKLAKEKAACEKLLERLRSQNTVPSENWSPTQRYQLRGVIISNNVLYICKKEPPPPEEGSSEYVADQWWKISYHSGLPEPMTVEKTTLEKVQDAAYKESDNRPFLIYANEDALSEEPEPLSDALRTFVRFDNRRFKQEVLEESPRDKKRMPAETSPTSPPKRQQRSNSITSIASNLASCDELSERDMDDVPLLDDKFDTDEGYEEDLDRAVRESFTDAYSTNIATANSNNRFDNVTTNKPTTSSVRIRTESNDGNGEITLHDTQESEQSGPLGTEMVQLAITHSNTASGNTTGLENIKTKFETNGSGSSSGSGSGSGSATASKSGINTDSSNATNTDDGNHVVENGTANGRGSTEHLENAAPQEADEKLSEKQPEMKAETKTVSSRPKSDYQMIADWDNPEGRYVPTSE